MNPGANFACPVCAECKQAVATQMDMYNKVCSFTTCHSKWQKVGLNSLQIKAECKKGQDERGNTTGRILSCPVLFCTVFYFKIMNQLAQQSIQLPDAAILMWRRCDASLHSYDTLLVWFCSTAKHYRDENSFISEHIENSRDKEPICTFLLPTAAKPKQKVILAKIAKRNKKSYLERQQNKTFIFLENSYKIL